MLNREIRKDRIRGCMLGGAVGDALGYAVEFLGENSIFVRYGEQGITAYELDRDTGKAIISDDTQMALFTANGLLCAETRKSGNPRADVAKAYQDWLHTQEAAWEKTGTKYEGSSWLLDVPELYDRRAPGNTCLAALKAQKGRAPEEDYIAAPQNEKKGCGGVMRVAPMGLMYPDADIRKVDWEGAQLAAITHGHSLGYMPAAVLTHIIHRIVNSEEAVSLKDTVLEAWAVTAELFAGDKFLGQLEELIDRAVNLAENDRPDVENIHRLGEGWVGDEALVIALYCALKYEHNFDKGIIASVNHRGDSDSTGAITGNILGAIHGYDRISEKWKTNLELKDVLLEMADDLARADSGPADDPAWNRKYRENRWKENCRCVGCQLQ